MAIILIGLNRIKMLAREWKYIRKGARKLYKTRMQKELLGGLKCAANSPRVSLQLCVVI